MKAVLTCIFAFVLLCCHYTVKAQQGGLFDKKYTPSFSEGTAKKYLRDIERKTGISISYSTSYVDVHRPIKLQPVQYNLSDALQKIFEGQPVLLKESGDKILVIANADFKKKEDRITVNGYVKDSASKEVLIGAGLFVPGIGTVAVTNSYGYYSFTLPAVNCSVLCSYVGYKTDTFSIHGKADARHDVQLSMRNMLTEVKVVSEKESSPDHSHLVYNDIKSRPAVLGENDVMRALQHIAGVQSGTDGTNAVMVRGGDPGQNLNLLDGVPLYYIDHFFGLTSVYNSEAIKSVDFHKGAFPARFGGRLSSVIDVNTKDGDMQRWGGQFSMGLVKSSLNLEGPIIKDKASIMLSARRTWLDVFWRPFTKALSLNFYDVNGKANYILNKNNRLYLSIYNGRDGLGFNVNSQGTSGKWGNTVASLKWNTIVNPRLFLNTIVTYSLFRYTIEDSRQMIDQDGISNTESYKGNSTIKDLAVNLQATWYATSSQRFSIGTHMATATFTPTELISTNTQNLAGNIIVPADKFQSNEFIFFAEDEVKINNRWIIRPGLHFANWFSERFNYSSIQPRFYTSYKLASSHSIYASYGQMAQFLHLISNNTYGLPTDFWLPSSDKIEPEESSLVTLGYTGKPVKNLWYNIEGYYKDIKNTTTYNMGKNLFDNSLKWDEKIIQGTGWSYGAEVSLKQKIKTLTFSAAYTLSWTWRKYAQLNGGEAFPYRFDRRHNIKATLQYQPSDKFDVAASWTFMSGEAITLPDQIYPDFDNNLLITPSTGTSSANYTYNYVKWNNYRLPAIHRLDIGLNFNKKKRKHYERTWSLGVFNAYGRKNIMYVDLQNDPTDGGNEFRLKGMSILRFIPYITYRLRF